MPEYAKMKNADLEALLKERGLPTGGKKADMVDRLTKDDAKKAEAPSKLHPEDEIDWDDEGEEGATDPTKAASAAPAAKEATEPAAAAATSQSNATTTAKAGGEGQASNPQAVPNQKADIDPSTTDDLSVKPPTEEEKDATEATVEEKTPAVDYTKGLAATNLQDEIEKRKRRAEKFGLKVDEDENLKKLARAQKFGEVGPPKGLDDALPERRKRGRDDNDDNGRTKRRGGGRFGGRGGRGGHRDSDRRQDEHDNRRPRDNRDNRRDGNWMSEADRRKADERKSKWAKPAAAS